MCRSKSREITRIKEDNDDYEYNMFTVEDPTAELIIYQEVCINKVPVKMEVDTGASISVVSEETYKVIQDRGHTQQLHLSEIRLKTYTRQSIRVLGQLPVEVRYGENNYNLVVQVVEGKGLT